MSGTQSDTKEQIVRTLRDSDEPALSAASIAEETGYAKRTINNYISDLVDAGRVKDTTIGNARAYYTEDSSGHKHADHTCQRCGREVTRRHDFAKVDLDAYFEGMSAEPNQAQFYVLCRFCYSDLASFLYGDDGAMHDYPHVHSWSIPDEQLKDVREDNTITTHPSTEFLPDESRAVYEAVEEIQEENGAASHGEIEECLRESDEFSFKPGQTIQDLINRTESRGLLYYLETEDKFRTAK